LRRDRGMRTFLAMGHVRKLFIPGPEGRLEAALRMPAPAETVRAAAVLAHPHPLYGGTLHNPVMFHSDRELHRVGFATLRFNFRGVGGSEGAHSQGKGECEDVGAAVEWLRGLVPGVPLLLVGYSFGSWCAVRYAASDPKVDAVVGIGLPVKLYPFVELQKLHRPVTVIQGSEDEISAPEMVEPLLARMSPAGRLVVVEGASHLFPGRTHEAAARVVEAALEHLETVTPAGSAPAGPDRRPRLSPRA
jgi:alpha/beta superfamily hydrolase